MNLLVARFDGRCANSLRWTARLRIFIGGRRRTCLEAPNDLGPWTLKGPRPYSRARGGPSVNWDLVGRPDRRASPQARCNIGSRGRTGSRSLLADGARWKTRRAPTIPNHLHYRISPTRGTRSGGPGVNQGLDGPLCRTPGRPDRRASPSASGRTRSRGGRGRWVAGRVFRWTSARAAPWWSSGMSSEVGRVWGGWSPRRRNAT